MVRLLKRLQQLKPDIIHFETLPMPMVDRWFLRRFKKFAKVVISVHDTSHRNESRIQFWGFIKCLRLFDHLIVLTSFSKDQVIRKTGISSNKIDIIPHGVFQCYQKEVNSPLKNMDAQEDKIILFFGVIKDYKGLDLLIASLAKLPEELLRKIRLVVAGYPFIPIEPLRRLAIELGVIDRITWDLRFIPENEVSSYFETATVVVFPYRAIDQSGAMHIALAFSKPIVATKVGGFPEILQDGVHGYLVEPDDSFGLAIALNRILTDPVRIHKMSLAVSNLADSLSWNMVARKTIHTYKKISNQYEMEV
jgi:glycosyltransferase involved in cell wall biosynthesis